MPMRDGPTTRMELLDIESRLRVPDQCQVHWYRVAGWLSIGRAVLDVGSGTGYGLGVLVRGGAASAIGIDPLPAGAEVQRRDISEVLDGTFDVVTAMDVIEHVEDDAAFLCHMLRVAKMGVFFSTPNWNRYRCTNEYHFREYTPDELRSLLSGQSCDKWATDDRPDLRSPWRVEEWDGTESNFGVWIRKAGVR